MSRWGRKDLDQVVSVAAEPGSRLRSQLSTVELIAIGLAIMVGAGVFTRAPTAYRNDAGPYVVVSFLIAAAVCLLVAFCFAECSTRIPVAGSAYTYAYVTLGRLFAWLVAALLVLEYTVGPALVARGWSLYLDTLLSRADIHIQFLRRPVDFVAALVVVLLAVFLLGGVKAASGFTVFATAIKLFVLVVVVAVGVLITLGYVSLHPDPPLTLVPPVYGTWQDNPVTGMLAAASALFYAFIGFDSVSTMAEEARYPRRRLPRGILWSLAIATALYLGVGWTITVLRPAEQVIDRDPTLASLLSSAGLDALAPVVTVGVLIGLTAGIAALLLGQSRIALAMSRDRLVPSWLAQLGPRRTPVRILMAFGAACAVLAAVIPDEQLQSLVNAGTLLIFVVVCVVTLLLRRESEPRSAGSFRMSFAGVVPVVGAVACIWLIVETVAGSLWLAAIIPGYLIAAWIGYEVLAGLGWIGDVPRTRDLARSRFWRWPGDHFIATAKLLREVLTRPLAADEPRFSTAAFRRKIAEVGFLRWILLDRSDVVVLSPDLAARFKWHLARENRDDPDDGYLAVRPTKDADVVALMVLPNDERVERRRDRIKDRLEKRGAEAVPDALVDAVACCMVRRLPLAADPGEDIGRWKPWRLVTITDPLESVKGAQS